MLTDRKLLPLPLAALFPLLGASCSSGETRIAEAATTDPVGIHAPVPQGRAPAAIFQVTAEGNTARYRIREQLAGFDLPNDAVGETSEVSGAIAVDASGAVIPVSSRIVVAVASLASDRDRRDNYVRRRTLEVEQFPTVELTVTGIRGVQLPVPTSGTRPLTIEGNLTVKSATRPTTWTGEASFSGDVISGRAATAFAFADFGIDKPRVASVLSVADTIRLEYDFRLRRQSPP